MRLKLYRAAQVSEAMARVRAELGPDALILATRRVDGGVEVAAALEPDQEAPPALSAAPAAPADPERLALLGFHAVPPAVQSSLQHGALDEALRNALGFAALPLTLRACPVLLVGAPGSGKTLTAVRLATRLVLAGTRPAIITADGRRAGAIEQLASFTRLLGIDLIVAVDPVLLGRALARTAGVPVLIDAPGTDPFDASHRDEIMAFAGTAKATVALVLAAGMDAAESAELACAYAEAGATMLVATRLDLARRLGCVLAAAHAGRLALAEAGVGPGAADGMVPLTPALLAARMAVTFPAKPGPNA